MDQDGMDELRDRLITILAAAEGTFGQRGDKGNEIFAEIGGWDVVLTIDLI